METKWDESKLLELIADKVEESLTLEYKAAAALSDKKEISKDVSSMANSAGGTIIYGMSEDPTNKHLPGTTDPIDRKITSKEWLEHIIQNIRPKIDGLVITPVPLTCGSNPVAYVVTIPQSTTAHQATDKRYYKRYNFESDSRVAETTFLFQRHSANYLARWGR